MWILSLSCALLGSATNLFFSLRYPSVAITPVIALVVVHPLGRAWDKLLKRSDDPISVFENGIFREILNSLNVDPDRSIKRRIRLWLAQGRWNEKEHACVYISSNVSFGFAFATDVCLLLQRSQNIYLFLGHCRTSKILPSRTNYNLPDLTHDLYSNSWVFLRRTHKALPSTTA